MNYSPNTFTYSDKTYTLNVTLYSSSDNMKTSVPVSFDPKDIQLFEYSTKLNALTVEGKIIYEDRYAKVDKFFGQNDVRCTVYFAEHEKTKAGAKDGIGVPDPKKTLAQVFLVQSLKPIDRRATVVTYELTLESLNAVNVYANLCYSNCNIGNQPVLQIFKNCISLAGLKADAESFDRAQANVSIPYMTKSNDTLETISKYLMDKLYYMPQKDVSVKMFFYDMFDDKYKILNLRDKNSAENTYPTVLSMFKSSVETMIQSEPTNLGAFANPVSTIEMALALRSKNVYSYSYADNSIGKAIYDVKENMNYVNNKVDETGYVKKYYNALQQEKMPYFREACYWNNHLDMYGSIVDLLERNAALVLNITGEIKRQVGTFTAVSLDRSIANLSNDSKQSLEEEKKKYKSFEGIWFNSKVTNIICPQKPSYRQKVALFRNFMPLGFES